MASPATAAPPRPSLQEETRSLLRNRVLDAVGELLGERAWRDVTMADVASRAGVSRQTLYNEFGTRQEFSQVFVLREVDRFIAAIRATVAAHADDPTTALTSAFELFLVAAEHDPLVRAIVAGDGGDELLALVTTHGEPVLEHATGQLCAVMLEHWDGADPADARLLAEAVVRLAISYAALPSGPSSMTAESIRTLLGPFVREALG